MFFKARTFLSALIDRAVSNLMAEPAMNSDAEAVTAQRGNARLRVAAPPPSQRS